MPPRYTIRQVVGTYRRKAFGTVNGDGTPRRPAYPPDAIVAFYGMLELAEEQPRRGRFESERLLRVLLEGPHGQGRRFARQVPFLVAQGDLVQGDDGALEVEGWNILQEGDTTIADRVARFRDRDRADPPLTGAQRAAAYRLRRRDAGTPPLPVTPRNDDVTLQRDGNVTSRRDDAVTVQRHDAVTEPSRHVTLQGVTVTPRAGTTRPQRRGDGYQVRDTAAAVEANRKRGAPPGWSAVGEILPAAAIRGEKR